MALKITGAALALGLTYLLCWPTPIQPVAWNPKEAPPNAGPLGPNDAFRALKRISLQDGTGPEDVDVDAQGRVYMGVLDGRILRHTPGAGFEELANTGGRPLGLAWGKDGRLWIADVPGGLLALDVQNKELQTVLREVDGKPLKLADDLDVGPDGTVYLSDASSRFALDAWKLDLIENGPSGRLVAYDPSTGKARTLLEDLHFANGVAVEPTGAWVLVNETSRYRVRRLWLKGPRAGQHDILVDNLPAFPDGISTGKNGVFWIALAAPRDPVLDATATHPWLRTILARLPEALQPQPKRTARVLGVDASGKTVHHLYDPEATQLSLITSVQEHAGRLYLASLLDPAYGVIPVPKTSAPSP